MTVWRLNALWIFFSIVSLTTALLIAIFWGEGELFKGDLIQDLTFILMSLYFVTVFVYSLKKIQVSLAEIKGISDYINYRVLRAQYITFILFFITFFLQHVLRLVHTYMKEQTDRADDTEYQIAACKVDITNFAVNCGERVILIIMLGIILMMTVKYTDKATASRQKRHLSRKISIDCDDCSGDDEELLQSPTEEKR